jgi:hypothetical protein
MTEPLIFDGEVHLDGDATPSRAKHSTHDCIAAPL